MTKKYIQSIKGVTLVELLVTIVLLAMVSILVMSILSNGLNSVKRVTNEAHIRDEADYLLASLLTEMYTLKTSEIKESHLTSAVDPSHSYLVIKKGSSTEYKLGFANGTLLLKDKELKPSKTSITLKPTSKIVQKAIGQYEIRLVLASSETNRELELISEIHIINDKE